MRKLQRIEFVAAAIAPVHPAEVRRRREHSKSVPPHPPSTLRSKTRVFAQIQTTSSHINREG
jgi:hypothetical protein